MSRDSHPGFQHPAGVASFDIQVTKSALQHVVFHECNAITQRLGGIFFTSCELDIKNSGNVRFKDMVERFKLSSQPRRPEGKEEWLAGERVDSRDYLLYGRLHLPSGRLDALYSIRLAPTLQALVAAISDPRSSLTGEERTRAENVSNVMFSLQHDIGKWCTEYTWSAEDGMWGVRVLHNFGRLGNSAEPSEGTGFSIGSRPKRVDEEDATGGGLKGRVSAGAEFYVSAKEKSAGVSTGIRFTTLSDPSTTPSQPPTTITALFNPMIGHISTAYAAKASRDLSLCSRFDFNVYSYDSEWAMGAEWWMRRGLSQPISDSDCSQSSVDHISHPQHGSPHSAADVRGVVKARLSTNNVRVARSSECCVIYQSAPFFPDCFVIVGRTLEANACQLGRCFESIKPIEAYHSNWT
ncbi:mitochondrial distribution and morphology protein 10 [Chiua virens]|nr:mitochondrial distribution and morphology protein 10 [Chiua virens]